MLFIHHDVHIMLFIILDEAKQSTIICDATSIAFILFIDTHITHSGLSLR